MFTLIIDTSSGNFKLIKSVVIGNQILSIIQWNISANLIGAVIKVYKVSPNYWVLS